MASITLHTCIEKTIDGEPLSAPVSHALADLQRDIAKVCAPTDSGAKSVLHAALLTDPLTAAPATHTAPLAAATPALTPTYPTAPQAPAPTSPAPADSGAPASVRIALHREQRAAESYRVQLSADGSELAVYAGDDLGFIYGIYHISRELLGVTDFWFWNDQHFTPRAAVAVSAGYRYESAPFAVRYRGWFINDEVLINTWKVDGRSDLPWLMAFEALLRLGGNMVIPGTDVNSRRNRAAAAKRGLYITHHHAEPLGAEMFIRTYPDLKPSYALYPEKFHALWQQSIEEQRGMRVVWNLGFRGQGDYPFWHNDPSYDTDEKRGALVGDLIKMQYDMVKAADPTAPCCTNLYGEVMELYQKGCLALPNDVIKIWADNGFGKMVSRRQGNHNPRVPSMPAASDKGAKGIYYHVSFYDLQAANHITMLPNSAEFVAQELSTVLAGGGSDYWIVNCSNVKPHVYMLDLVAELWRNGAAEPAAEAVARHRAEYASRYYGGKEAERISALIADFASCAPKYGDHEDEHAGEQFANHVARAIVSQYMRNSAGRAKQLLWATDAPDLAGQAAWYKDICTEAAVRYRAYSTRCQMLAPTLAPAAATLLEDSLLLQADVLAHCYRGAALAAISVRTALAGDYKRAFYLAGKARAEYKAGDAALRAREHGKWKGFYANECFAALKLSAQLLSGLMAYLRNLGDGPDFYKWQREFTYSAADRNVVTLLLWENELTDDEMFAAMEARLDDSTGDPLQ